MNEFQERQWIEAARRGDQDAFASLVHLYEKRLMALALRMCRSPEDAAEAAQFPGRGQFFHLALPADLQCLRRSSAAGGPPPERRRSLSQ